MTRISYVERDQADPRARPFYDSMAGYGPFANQIRTMAHRPPILDHVMSLLFELRREAVLPRRQVELVAVAVANLHACAYCIAHHAPTLRVSGMSEAGIERLLEFEDHPELDETDRLVIDCATQVTRAPDRIADPFFSRLKMRFTEPQIAELTWRIGLAGAFARINQALDIDIESDPVQAG